MLHLALGAARKCFISAQFKGLVGHTGQSTADVRKDSLLTLYSHLEVVIDHKVLVLGHQPLPLGPRLAVHAAHGESPTAPE